MKIDDRFANSLTEDGRYRLLVEAVTDYAIYMLDVEGRVTSWNPGAERFKGYKAHEILGESFSRFYTEEDRQDGLPQRALQMAASGGKFDQEGWRVRKDGRRFWAHVVIDPIFDPNGNLVGYAKVTRDLSDRRDTQHALEETREALIQAQKMEAIGQLTGGIAHDFNNLLMAILGSLEMLRKHLPGDPRTLSLLDNAAQAGERGVALTQRMLAFARKQDLDPKPLDIPALVGSMQSLLQSSIGPDSTIETHFPPRLPAAHADGHQLELAILNLLVNARDAMPDGGLVRLSAREETLKETDRGNLKPGRYVCVSVEDSGVGMDAATLARASEPFFTTKEVGKGTGLGLSMVHGFAEQSDGRLVLKSRVGAGTTAELWLPATEAAVPLNERDVPLAADSTGERSLTVLAVDDDVLVLMNTVMMLEDMGHRVIEANSGAEALRLVQQDTSLDLVLTDHAMPHMTGSQLAREIGAHRPDLPVILTTGYADLPADGNAKLPRLLKPFRQEDLAVAISQVLRIST